MSMMLNQMNQMNLNELHFAYTKDPLLVDEFALSLRNFIIKTVKSHCRHQSASSYDTVEDAVGESLLDVWGRLASFNPAKAQFTTWVTMIVLSNIVDIYRKFNKRKEIELEQNYPGPPQEGPTRKLSVNQLIDSLPVESKLFIMMKIRGLSEQELADHFSKNPKWAKNKWHRLAEKLRLLAADGGLHI